MTIATVASKMATGAKLRQFTKLLNLVNSDIRTAAKDGQSSTRFYMYAPEWDKDVVQMVQQRFRDYRYTILYKYIPDPRDGDYAFFDISWEEHIMNDSLADIMDIAAEPESMEELINSLYADSVRYAKIETDEKSKAKLYQTQSDMCKNIAERIDRSWNAYKEKRDKFKKKEEELAHWGFLKYDEACCSKCGHIIYTHFDTTDEAREKWGGTSEVLRGMWSKDGFDCLFRLSQEVQESLTYIIEWENKHDQ